MIEKRIERLKTKKSKYEDILSASVVLEDKLSKRLRKSRKLKKVSMKLNELIVKQSRKGNVKVNDKLTFNLTCDVCKQEKHKSEFYTYSNICKGCEYKNGK